MPDSGKYGRKDPVAHATTAPVDEEVATVGRADPLKKDLKGRHMQMIAIGMPNRFPPEQVNELGLIRVPQVAPLVLVFSSGQVVRCPRVVPRLWYVGIQPSGFCRS